MLQKILLAKILAKIISVFLVVFTVGFYSPLVAQVVGEVKTVEADTSKTEDEKKKKKDKPKGKAFDEVVEDFQVIKGFFTLYQNSKENKVYLEILPDQLNQIYLCNISRSSGDGQLFDSGAMLEEFPFFFTLRGKRVQMMQKNLNFRADAGTAMARAVERDIPNSIWASSKTLSEPHPDRGSVLVDANDFFMMDVGRVGSPTGRNKKSYSMDRSNSYFSSLKSFENNTEIAAMMHFTSGRSRRIYTLADSRSMFHRYHFSLSKIPESSYQPRVADDRLGHFVTLYQDYTSTLREDPYQRYVNRWHLEKSEPKFNLSKPRKPIVFWLESTIPVEYREAVKQGALLWNSAFEKLGFKDAIEVKQMPDDADWDPADVRYNTIRWIVQPGQGYAVGPSRANPFTGEIYDADIRISSDFVRFFYNEFDEFVTPASWQNASINDLIPGMDPLADTSGHAHETLPIKQCRFAAGFTHQLAFGWSLLQSETISGKSSNADMQKYIHDGIINLVAHEVGHTLGLRHNFKASSAHSQNDVDNPSFTQKNGLTGSVMDYTPVNLSGNGKQNGNFFQTSLGAYDYWAIEYAYKPYDKNSKESEKAMLEKIAGKLADPQLTYGTDEDAFGLSVRSIDPTCNFWDIGSDPLQYYRRRLDLTNTLWKNLLNDFKREGGNYSKYRRVFGQGINEYAIAALNASKFIGGIYHHRDHIGDPKNRSPFEVVPAKKQREALQFIIDRFFSPESFNFDPELLNRLASDRQWDFQGTVFQMSRIDYPVHGIIQLLHSITLSRLYNSLALARVQDNELRFKKGQEVFTMAEMFTTLRENIWQELKSGDNIISFRRELQRIHLYVLNNIFIDWSPFFPQDAVTLGFADLQAIQSGIDTALQNNSLDSYSRAHLQETKMKINAMLEANRLRWF